MKLWLARDADGELRLHSRLPGRDDRGFWLYKGARGHSLVLEEIPQKAKDLTWEDKPRAVKVVSVKLVLVGE